ncbi:hypothetical protein AO071_25025 [Pseudomonas syringae]|nr:hypothetical protein AO071_25025 [Pseudomonas syringae]
MLQIRARGLPTVQLAGKWRTEAGDPSSGKITKDLFGCVIMIVLFQPIAMLQIRARGLPTVQLAGKWLTEAGDPSIGKITKDLFWCVIMIVL